MPYVTLRFYGRFVIAEPVGNGHLTGAVSFLAPNMAASAIPERRFQEHHVLLTAPRAALNRDHTTSAPTSRTMSDVRAGYAELLVWEIGGFDLALDGPPSFTLEREQGTTLVELTEPIQSIKYGRQIDMSGLVASDGGLTSTSIRLSTGRGRAFASFKNNYNFVTESDARDGDPTNDRMLGTDGQLADVVEVTVQADADGLLRLRGQSVAGSKIEICIDAKGFAPTLSFTNLCPALPSDSLYDLEFARYYDYLRIAQQNAPIPAVVPRAGMSGDCNQSCHFYYESRA